MQEKGKMTAVLCDRCGLGTESCPACGSIVCDRCTVVCERCGEQVCRECINKYAECLTCLEKEYEEDENYD